MAGIFGLSVNSEIIKSNEFSLGLFKAGFYLGHWGETCSGLAFLNGEKISSEGKTKSFRFNFEDKLRKGITGTEGICYCGSEVEPYKVSTMLGVITACFSGNIINKKELVYWLEDSGQFLGEGQQDIDALINVLVRGENIIDGIKKIKKSVKGAYSLLLLTPKGIYAFRSPDGHWPLIIGQKEGAVAIASESNSFAAMGIEVVRDIMPGELVLLKNGSWKTLINLPANNPQACSILAVYTLYPNSIFNEVAASTIRWRLGAALALRDIQDGFTPESITCRPDSGRQHALGYLEEWRRSYMAGKVDFIPSYKEDILIRYSSALKSSALKTEEARKFEAEIKILPGSEYYYGKTVVVCVDSIRGGNQIKNSISQLKRMGFKEIHFRISFPRIQSHCPWGKTLKEQNPLLAVGYKTDKEMAEALGIASIKFNTVENLIDTTGMSRKRLCIDCTLSEQELLNRLNRL